jgi:hypothetical protein
MVGIGASKFFVIFGDRRPVADDHMLFLWMMIKPSRGRVMKLSKSPPWTLRVGLCEGQTSER